MDDKPTLVRTLVGWGTSLHRPGPTKVYVATKLLKAWAAFKIDATSALLDVLCDIEPGNRLRAKAVFDLVAELVRAGLFSVPRYMQWLIARGGLQQAADLDRDDGPCASRLLVELPLHCLPENHRVQRSSLLRRAGQYSTVEEANDIETALRFVDHGLGLSRHIHGADSQCRHVPLRKLLRMVSSSSKAVQTSIGAHLRDVVTPELAARLEPVVALAVFRAVRTMLETVDDFAMLSHVLKAFAASACADVLAACADTLHSHLETFAALESADALFSGLLDRLRAITREQGVAARPLLAALSSLVRRLPHREEIAKQLMRELVQSDRSNALDACSPVSDNMAMQAQSTDGEVSEQIDKLLASGNRIDHPTMNRLFRNIVPKLEAGWTRADESCRVFGLLLSRLRIFDPPHFDKLMADWVSHIRTLKGRPPLMQLLPLLVSLGCLPMSTMIRTANAAPPAVDGTPSSVGPTPPSSAVYLQELLQLLVMPLPMPGPLDVDEAYRYHVQQKSARSEQPKALVNLIRNALVEYSALPDAAAEHNMLSSQALQGRLVETLKYLVVADSSVVANALNVGHLSPGATALVHSIVTQLLLPCSDGSTQTSFDEILGLADELTMPFCQLKLNLDLAAPRPASGELDHESQSRFESFARAMDRAIEARNIMWTSMLPCLSQDITRNLSSQAHSRFLDLMPSLKSSGYERDASCDHRIHLAQNLLAVIEAIIAGQPPPKVAHLTATLVDKLSDLWEIVASRDQGRERARQKVLSHWLPALLRFITLHSISSEPMQQTPTLGQAATARAPMSPYHEARARIILALCGLLLELESQPEAARGALPQEVRDIAVLLVDGLPDELRVQCAKAVLFLPGNTCSTSTTSDPRLYYLFSMPQPTAADGLRLAHRDRAAAPYSAAARGMGAMYGVSPAAQEKLTPFALRRWEILSEPTPNIGENDTSLSLGLFEAFKIQ